MQGQLRSEPTTRSAAPDGQHFAQWEGVLELKSPDIEKAVLLEMKARLVRMALNLPAAPQFAKPARRKSKITDRGLNKVERMACFVARRYTDRQTVQEIADVVKLHPNYAMNLFQKTFGPTLVTDLPQHRVSHVQRLLATTYQTVAEAAFNSGFNSIGRFNEAFRRACGCSPGEYRHTHSLEEMAGKPQA